MLRRMWEKAQILGILFVVLLLVAMIAGNGGCNMMAGIGKDLQGFAEGDSGKHNEDVRANDHYRPTLSVP